MVKYSDDLLNSAQISKIMRDAFQRIGDNRMRPRLKQQKAQHPAKTHSVYGRPVLLQIMKAIDDFITEICGVMMARINPACIDNRINYSLI